jgi:hypothetical protein
MPQRTRKIYAQIAKTFGRRLSGPKDRAWGETVIGPTDPPDPADFAPPSREHAGSFGSVGSFDPTEPAGLLPDGGGPREEKTEPFYKQRRKNGGRGA